MPRIYDMSHLKILGCLLRYLLSFPAASDHSFPSMQVEMGSKNHEVVPSTLIAQVSGLRNGGVNKILGILAKRNLVARVRNSKCTLPITRWGSKTDVRLDDGYRLTYGGYDYLAMRALSKRDSVYSIGNQIGVGKESGLLFFS